MVLGIVDGLPDCFRNIAFRGGQGRVRKCFENWLCEVCIAARKELRDRNDRIRPKPGGWRITGLDELKPSESYRRRQMESGLEHRQIRIR